jgi:hypothetical protein
MGNRTVVVTDIPETDVQTVMDAYATNHCTDITKEQQADGLWTVRVTCPDEKNLYANYLTDI